MQVSDNEAAKIERRCGAVSNTAPVPYEVTPRDILNLLADRKRDHKRIVALKAEIKQLMVAIDHCAICREVLAGKKSLIEREWDDLEAENKKLHAIHARYVKDLTAAAEQIAAVETSRQAIMAQLDAERAENEHLQTVKMFAEDQLNAHRKRIAELEADIAEREKELKQLRPVGIVVATIRDAMIAVATEDYLGTVIERERIASAFSTLRMAAEAAKEP